VREFPPQPLYPEPSYLVCVPRRLIPLFCGALSTLEKRNEWATDEDWQQGYQWITETQADLMSGCVDRIVEMQERTYRLLDTALNGTVYSVTPAEISVPDPPADPTKPTISPAIPDGPASTAPQLLTSIALRNRIDRLVDLVDNGLNGSEIAPPVSSSQPSVRDNLEAIRALIEASGANTDEVESLINTVILALA
jgi:hypothetical protein